MRWGNWLSKYLGTYIHVQFPKRGRNPHSPSRSHPSRIFLYSLLLLSNMVFPEAFLALSPVGYLCAHSPRIFRIFVPVRSFLLWYLFPLETGWQPVMAFHWKLLASWHHSSYHLRRSNAGQSLNYLLKLKGFLKEEDILRPETPKQIIDAVQRAQTLKVSLEAAKNT